MRSLTQANLKIPRLNWTSLSISLSWTSKSDKFDENPMDLDAFRTFLNNIQRSQSNFKFHWTDYGEYNKQHIAVCLTDDICLFIIRLKRPLHNAKAVNLVQQKVQVIIKISRNGWSSHNGWCYYSRKSKLNCEIILFELSNFRDLNVERWMNRFFVLLIPTV